MNLEIQKFYRFLIPGALLIASNYNTIKFLMGFQFSTPKDVNSYLLFLGIAALLIGVPLYWIYVVFWHIKFEQKPMQKLEVEWLNFKDQPSDEDIQNYSNLIWNYMDSDKSFEPVTNWLRNNFLLIHSLGCSEIAIGIGFIFYLSIKHCSFFTELESLLWLIWVFLFICIYLYRAGLKKRYLKRLEIFIKVNSNKILEKSEIFEPK